MTEIDFRQHAPDYKKNLEDSTLATNTIRKRQLAIEEFIRYTRKNKLTIKTEEKYESIDKIRKYFEETSIHGTKVSAIRDFLEYIGTQVDSRTEDQLDEIKERISLAKMKNGDQTVGTINHKEIENKLLDDEEIEAAKEQASRKTSLLIDLMLDTAARPGEIVAMTPEKVDFEEGSFKINATWSDAEGEIQDYAKHGSSRTVKIKEENLERLEQFIKDNEIGEDELVFGSYRSGVYRPIKKAFTQAQVRVEDGKTRVTPHWLRHNACSRLIQNGNSKEQVQRYMGHSSVKITEVYEHFSDSEAVDVELV